MVQAYNFLASWQLFPEKSNYEQGTEAKSGNYKIESSNHKNELMITQNWVTLDNEAFYTQYSLTVDEQIHPFNNQAFADSYIATIKNASSFVVEFYTNEVLVQTTTHEILANGHLRFTQETPGHNPYKNVDIYYKQLSVLPYASSVGSVAVRPTEEGVIKHKALQAMEEQTNMHLNQIKEQIELLARQAQEIRKRRELSMMVYDAKLSFQPVIGQTYYLYQKRDDSFLLSLVSPKEWGGTGPFKQFVSAVKLLSDHTWTEIPQ